MKATNIGVAGCWSRNASADITYNICHYSNHSVYNIASLSNDYPKCIIQKMHSSVSCRKKNTKLDIEFAWAGPLWSISEEDNGIDMTGSFKKLLTHAFHSENIFDLHKVNGDYVACVISKEKVLLFRSLGSTTQLYYNIHDNKIIWSNLLCDIVDDYIGELEFSLLARLTWNSTIIPYNNISRLEPGEYILYDNNRCMKNYFDYYKTNNDSISLSNYTLRDWGEFARYTLLNVVKKRTNKSRKVGLFMSGGIDSSALAWCLSDLGIDTQLYHWGSKTNPMFNESEVALKTAQKLGLPLKFIEVDNDVRPNGRYLDPNWEIITPTSNLMNWMEDAAMYATQDGVDCLLGGYGSEKIFCRDHIGLNAGDVSMTTMIKDVGLLDSVYYIYHLLSMSGSIKHIYRTLTTKDRKALVKKRFSELEKYRKRMFRRSLDILSDSAIKIIIENFDIDDNYDDKYNALLNSYNVNIYWPNALNHIMIYNDKELIENFKDIIPEYYYSVPYGGEILNKVVLRAAFLDLLPKEVFRHRAEMNFTMLLNTHLTNNKNVCIDLLNNNSILAKKGIIIPEKIISNLSGSKPELQMVSQCIYQACMAEIWLQTLNHLRS